LLRKLKILVVDDSSTVLDILSQILRSIGVRGRIDIARNGIEAWEKIQNNDYDVVISDVSMPQMDGLELKNLLRSSPKFARLPFLIISGEVSESVMAAAVTSSSDSYLCKPFSSVALKAELKQLAKKADSKNINEINNEGPGSTGV
jgi:two-component system chemotaxis response regulator CheY